VLAVFRLTLNASTSETESFKTFIEPPSSAKAMLLKRSDGYSQKDGLAREKLLRRPSLDGHVRKNVHEVIDKLTLVPTLVVTKAPATITVASEPALKTRYQKQCKMSSSHKK